MTDIPKDYIREAEPQSLPSEEEGLFLRAVIGPKLDGKNQRNLYRKFSETAVPIIYRMMDQEHLDKEEGWQSF